MPYYSKGRAMIDDATDAGPFWDGDIPLSPVHVTLDEALTGFNAVAVTLDGDALPEITIAPEDTSVDIPLTDALVGGLHVLSITALALDDSEVTARLKLGDVRLYVMEDDGWYNLDSARADWAGAPTSDGSLWSHLETARNDVIEYGTKIGHTLEDGDPIPANWKTAQLMEARALWAKTNAGRDDQSGSDDFAVTLYPMDLSIRRVIRPKHGAPVALMAPNGN